MSTVHVEIRVRVRDIGKREADAETIGECQHTVTLPTDLQNVTFPAHSKVNFLEANAAAIAGFASNCATSACWEACQRYLQEVEAEQGRQAIEAQQVPGVAKRKN